MTKGQRSDYVGARLLLADFPAAKQLLDDKSYDAEGFLDALRKRKISTFIPARFKRTRSAISRSSIIQITAQDREFF